MTGRGSSISGQGITSNLLLHFPHCQRTFGHEWAMLATNCLHRVVAYGFVFCRFFAVAAKLALPHAVALFAVAATLAHRRTRRQESPDRTPT